MSIIMKKNTILLKIIAVNPLGDLFAGGPVELTEAVFHFYNRADLLTSRLLDRYNRDEVDGHLKRQLVVPLTGGMSGYELKQIMKLLAVFPEGMLSGSYKGYAKATRVVGNCLGTHSLKDHVRILRTMVKLNCRTKPMQDNMVAFISRFATEYQEDMLVALSNCAPDMRNGILAALGSGQAELEADEHGMYHIQVGEQDYRVGVQNPGSEARVGVFIGDSLRIGKKYLVPTFANRYTKSEEGEFYANGVLKQGRREYLPNAINGFRKSIDGEWDENGRLKQG